MKFIKVKLSIILTIFFLSLNSTPCYPLDTGEKLVYITFDDGPTKLTNQILDILKENDVKATFFLIGGQIQYNKNVVLRIYNEGHGIGLHSYTHEKSKIYKNKDSFLEEMKRTQKEIEDLTNYKANILRFPFGCNNLYYKLDRQMLNLLHEEGLKVYDWNVDSRDGANHNLPPDKITRNSLSKRERVILLLHCSNLNKNTVKALPSIIKYYRENGYKFETINCETYEQYKLMK